MAYRSIETKLFFWVLTFCLVFGLGTASLIIHSEESRRLDSAGKSLVLVSSRYKNRLQQIIVDKVKLGVAANKIVLEALIGDDGYNGSVILKDIKGGHRSTDGYSGGFLSNLNKLTTEQKRLFAISEKLWKDIAPLVVVDFYNFYFISNNNFNRVYPKQWALEIESDHNYSTDIFYSVATPEKNPSRKPVWTEIYFDSIWKKWMISLIIPLYDKDAFLGITGSDFILDDIFEGIENMAQTEGWCHGFLFDDDQNLIVHQDYMKQILTTHKEMNAKFTSKNLRNEGLSQLIAKTADGKQPFGRATSFYDKDKLSYVVIEPIESLNWNLGIFTSHGAVVKGLSSLEWQIFLTSIGLAVFLSLILNYSFKKLILDRLRQLGAGVSAISAGDHDFELKVICDDEVGTVEQGFIHMRNSVKDKISELEHKNDELQQFAYVASHDLQEPLRMVSSYVQLLAKRYKGQLDSDADEFINFAVDGANRMYLLINALLTYSRVGRKETPSVLFSTDGAVQEALKNLTVSIEESKAEVTLISLPSIIGDRSQFVQLFQNLLANAIKFRKEDAIKISIDCEEQDSCWIFSISDNGIGMNSEFGSRIFTIFQRLHNRTEYPGTGIGLAICKKIVERHGGRIWVEAQEGVGSTFLFTIPKRKESL